MSSSQCAFTASVRNIVKRVLHKKVLSRLVKYYTFFQKNATPRTEKLKECIVFLPKHLFPEFYARLKRAVFNEMIPDNPKDPLPGLTSLAISSRQNTRPLLVSVIVPCYNHAPYLKQRLETVFAQTYANFEVLLLDDASSDGSRDILQNYQKRYPEKTRTFFNEKNSGSPFVQWKKGISNAKGDLIWIAESDDWCAPDFLEKTVPAFSCNAVKIAFCHTFFMHNGKQEWSQESYLCHVSDPSLWGHDFFATAHELVQGPWGLQNIIPNTSGCVFRKPAPSLSILQDPEWLHMRVCGDWIFYLHIARGGLVFYTAETQNYYRQHKSNTSVSAHKRMFFYQEHLVVLRHILQNYRTIDTFPKTFIANLRHFYRSNAGDENISRFDELCASIRPQEWKQQRKPNVLMFLFSFVCGGGELFPIHLANALYAQNTCVTLVNCGWRQDDDRIRKIVDSNIPVIDLQMQFHFWNALEAFAPEIIHSHHCSVDQAISTLKHFKDTKNVVTMHGMHETVAPYDRKNTFPTLLRETDCWCYLSEKNLQPFLPYGIDRMRQLTKVANGLPSRMAHPKISRAGLNIAPGAFCCALASRARRDKGWPEAMEAVRRVRTRTRQDIHLILLGDGEVYDSLKESVLPDWIHLIGFAENVRGYLDISDLLLLPSVFAGETFPLILIEGMMCHCPVLASDIGEIPSMLTGPSGEKAGDIIPLKNGKIDMEIFEELLVRYVENREYYNSRKADVDIVAKRFEIKTIAQNYLDIYQRLLRPAEWRHV